MKQIVDVHHPNLDADAARPGADQVLLAARAERAAQEAVDLGADRLDRGAAARGRHAASSSRSTSRSSARCSRTSRTPTRSTRYRRARRHAARRSWTRPRPALQPVAGAEAACSSTSSTGCATSGVPVGDPGVAGRSCGAREGPARLEPDGFYHLVARLPREERDLLRRLRPRVRARLQRRRGRARRSPTSCSSGCATRRTSRS